MKKLDTVFSQFIRLRASDDAGRGSCFTCHSVRHFSEVDAGHFMSRACMSTRWDEQNVQFQCKRCNGFRSGEQFLFSKHLDEKYGEGTAEALLIASKKTRKFTRDELEQMYHHYKRRVDELRSQKGL
ncbi:MAG: recombination protein NinG [Planctomycetota bacterium]